MCIRDSSHLFLGLPLGLVSSGLHSHLFLDTLPSSILARCPHYLNLAASILFNIAITPPSSLILSFLCLSLLVFSIIALKTYIFADCILLSSLVVVLHVSAPYSKIGVNTPSKITLFTSTLIY